MPCKGKFDRGFARGGIPGKTTRHKFKVRGLTPCEWWNPV